MGNETMEASTVSYSVVKGGSTARTHIYTGDPKLGSLAENGEMTQSHAIATGSSAIDNGTSAGARPWISGRYHAPGGTAMA